MMSLWDALRMNMMISYQELVRTFLSRKSHLNLIFYIFTFLPPRSVQKKYNWGSVLDDL
ncbi:hypothetical protein KLQU111871_26655 [Klebsiella quasivariicola]